MIDKNEETFKNRKIARKMASDAVFQGDIIAGMLADLEHLAEPFYLGLDYATDDSDLDVFP